MKRLLLLLVVLATGCVVTPYYAVGAAMPPGQAERIAMDFARSQGLNPVGVRNIHLERAGRVWDVLLTLGPPSCGLDRVHVGRWDGRIYGSRPAVYPCGSYYEIPVPPVY